MQLTEAGGTDTWAYPDLHRDMVVTANQAGMQTGSTVSYDPFSDTVTPTTETDAYTYGYEGEHDIGTDTTTPITLTEMDARVYAPTLGRFLQIDPIPGGSANNYDYTYQGPINGLDLGGTVSKEEAEKALVVGVITLAFYLNGGKSDLPDLEKKKTPIAVIIAEWLPKVQASPPGTKANEEGKESGGVATEKERGVEAPSDGPLGEVPESHAGPLSGPEESPSVSQESYDWLGLVLRTG